MASAHGRVWQQAADLNYKPAHRPCSPVSRTNYSTEHTEDFSLMSPMPRPDHNLVKTSQPWWIS